jgi:hypothetical protein
MPAPLLFPALMALRVINAGVRPKGYFGRRRFQPAPAQARRLCHLFDC